MSRLLRRLIAVPAATAALALGAALPAPPAAAPAPDPDNPTVWGCFPGQQPNPCEGSLATTYLRSTVLQPRKVDHVATPAVDADPAVDCFFVYPTVSGALSQSAPKRMTDEVRAILEYQAQRFHQHCRIYAPVYRQVTTFAALSTQFPKAADTQATPTAAFNLAYRDVKDAWHDYLANDNHGRGVVLLGHSQGSGLLIRLLREEIDPDPEERSRIVSAIVPGGNLTVLKGQGIGGDLQHLPLCTAGSQTGCAVAWSTFGGRPPSGATFGRLPNRIRGGTGLPTDPATQEVACTDPAELSGDGGNLETYTRSDAFPGITGATLSIMFLGLSPKAATPWVSPGERYSSRCQYSGGAHVMIIRPASAWTITPLASPTADFGLHLADVNLPLGNLVRLVGQQAAAWAAAHPTS